MTTTKRRKKQQSKSEINICKHHNAHIIRHRRDDARGECDGAGGSDGGVGEDKVERP